MVYSPRRNTPGCLGVAFTKNGRRDWRDWMQIIIINDDPDSDEDVNYLDKFIVH